MNATICNAPAYNVEKYIYSCLQSVLDQRYQNWEAIVVNDGSTDGTTRIITEVYSKIQGFTIIEIPNSGLSIARNVGLSHCTGDYIVFLDSDDMLDPDALSLLSCQLESDNLPDVIAFTAKSFEDGETVVFNSNDDYYQRPLLTQKRYKPLEYYSVSLEKKCFVASACLMAYKKRIFEDYDLKFESGIIHEDELFTRLLLFSVETLSFVNLPIYLRRNRNTSISKSRDSSARLWSFTRIVTELEKLNYIHHSPLLEEDIKRFNNRVKSILRRNKLMWLEPKILLGIIRMKLNRLT